MHERTVKTCMHVPILGLIGMRLGHQLKVRTVFSQGSTQIYLRSSGRGKDDKMMASQSPFYDEFAASKNLKSLRDNYPNEEEASLINKLTQLRDLLTEPVEELRAQVSLVRGIAKLRIGY